MKTTTKKRICWNCHGNVSLEACNCIYCGVYLNRDEEFDEAEEEQEELDPPYKLTEHTEKEEVIHNPPYTSQHLNADVAKPGNLVSILRFAGWKSIILSITMLLSGAVFLLFAVILLLFAKDGFFTLQWNANRWFFYLIAALPLLFFGWQSLEKLDD